MKFSPVVLFHNWVLAACCFASIHFVHADESAKKVWDDTSLAKAHAAHAHNDYLHRRPLLDALDQGFGSAEADVFLVDGKLLVAHTRLELSPQRTLESLYLDPLRERIRANDGSVHGDGSPFTLLIDLKSDGESTFKVLNQMLAEYSEVFSRIENGKLHPGPVRAIVSGNRPIETILSTSPCFVGIDGRLSDIDSDLSVEQMPLISDNWRQHFKWQGQGQIPQDEAEKLDRLVKQIHDEGRQLRFWATRDDPAMWKTLRNAKVDMINTDNLEGLSRFLLSTSR